ncbi:MAG TPA: DUF599 domain-containing protein [Burkholderiaceae bacterium]|nr:DUF599 domain-containing protein [Burkholderiaceae bacterium]
MSAFSNSDWIALGLWVLAWFGYAAWAERAAATRPSLMAALARHRRAWMREAYFRDPRITDAALIGNLMQSATFFSSTTLLVLGASFALLGTIERGSEVLDVVRSLPFASRVTQDGLESKVLVMSLVFVYAFMRFTWSLRQFNLVNIMVGAFPGRRERLRDDDPSIDAAARLNELAGGNFAQGLRAYYYAVPVLLWLVNPLLFGAATVAITGVLWFMEFRSATVRALADEQRAEGA